MNFNSVYNYLMGVFSSLINIPLSLLHVLVYTVIEFAKTVCMIDGEVTEEETEEGEPNNNNKHIGFRQ